MTKISPPLGLALRKAGSWVTFVDWLVPWGGGDCWRVCFVSVHSSTSNKSYTSYNLLLIRRYVCSPKINMASNAKNSLNETSYNRDSGVGLANLPTLTDSTNISTEPFSNQDCVRLPLISVSTIRLNSFVDGTFLPATTPLKILRLTPLRILWLRIPSEYFGSDSAQNTLALTRSTFSKKKM